MEDNLPNTQVQNFFKHLQAIGVNRCELCSHKNVCKKIDEKAEKCCEDYIQQASYKFYGNINDLFQPIFDWIQLHYPAGGVKFEVDRNSARMYLEYGPFVLSRNEKSLNALSCYPIGEKCEPREKKSAEGTSDSMV